MLLHNQYEFNTNTDLIGSGGFARVYKAFDINLHRTVALKRFDKKDTKYSVLNEIRRCFDFNHPNIIRYLNCFQVESINNFGEKEVVEFGVMEYADTGDFTQLIDKKIRISDDELKEIVLGILNGLQYLHTPNAMHQKPAIIHRDLKASNILFTKIGGKLIPKICDFGISKEIGSLGATTATGTGYLGTIEYMAPEQINLAKYGKDGKLQPNTDLWALGCMLYEYFTGKAPFGKRTDGDMQIDIQNNILDNEPSYPNSIPLNYKEIIQKCLVKNAADRVQDANTLRQIILGKKVENGENKVEKPLETKKGMEVITFGEIDKYNGEVRQKKIIINEPIPKPAPPPGDDEPLTVRPLVFAIAGVLLIIFMAYGAALYSDSTQVDATEEVATEEISDALEAEFTNSADETFIYSGQTIDEIPYGKGIAVYSNGDKYDGEFVKGIREGAGVYYWKDGEKFEGSYKNNLRNGYGKFYDANGNIIQSGFYVNGVHQ